MITVSDSAAKKIKSAIEKRGRGLGIRLGVKTTGCSGLAYVLEFVDSVNESDHCFESNDCQVYVDPKSLVYMTGLTVDYVRKGLNEGFEFVNPNERDRCGCGESFRV
jgi:iron-sulfur cluster assembly protein